MTLYIYTLHSLVSSRFDFSLGPIAVLLVSQPQPECTISLYLDVFQYIVFLCDTSTLAVAYYNQISPVEDLFRDFYRAYTQL